jgi:hypothetical protein
MLLNKTNDCLRNSIGYPLKEDGTIRHANLFQTVPYLNSEEGFNHLLYSEKRRAQKDDLRLKVSIIARLPPKFR